MYSWQWVSMKFRFVIIYPDIFNCFSNTQFWILRNAEYDHVNSVFPKPKSIKVIRAMSFRQTSSITQFSNGIYISLEHAPLTERKQLRFAILSINSWMLMRKSDMLRLAAKVWKSVRVRIMFGITIAVFGFLITNG